MSAMPNKQRVEVNVRPLIVKLAPSVVFKFVAPEPTKKTSVDALGAMCVSVMLDTATRAAAGWLSAGGYVSRILTAVELRIVGTLGWRPKPCSTRSSRS